MDTGCGQDALRNAHALIGFEWPTLLTSRRSVLQFVGSPHPRTVFHKCLIDPWYRSDTDHNAKGFVTNGRRTLFLPRYLAIFPNKRQAERTEVRKRQGAMRWREMILSKLTVSRPS